VLKYAEQHERGKKPAHHEADSDSVLHRRHHCSLVSKQERIDLPARRLKAEEQLDRLAPGEPLPAALTVDARGMFGMLVSFGRLPICRINESGGPVW
jgi:hypothetical protein